MPRFLYLKTDFASFHKCKCSLISSSWLVTGGLAIIQIYNRSSQKVLTTYNGSKIPLAAYAVTWPYFSPFMPFSASHGHITTIYEIFAKNWCLFWVFGKKPITNNGFAWQSWVHLMTMLFHLKTTTKKGLKIGSLTS